MNVMPAKAARELESNLTAGSGISTVRTTHKDILGAVHEGATQHVQQYNYFSHIVFLRPLGNNVPVSTPTQEGNGTCQSSPYLPGFGQMIKVRTSLNTL
jgi:hypothetical protein